MGDHQIDDDDHVPFSFELIVEVHTIEGEIQRFLAFHADVEQLLEANEALLQQHIEGVLEGAPESHHGEIVDSYAEELHEQQTLFPSIHRESMFLSLYNLLEHKLNNVAEWLGEEVSAKMKLSDLRGAGIERAIRYIELVVNFDLKEAKDTLSFLREANKLRNIIVHAGGLLPAQPLEAPNPFVQRTEGLSGSAGCAVVIGSMFVPHFADQVIALFKAVHDSMQARKDNRPSGEI